jgi:hypothetical protein
VVFNVESTHLKHFAKLCMKSSTKPTKTNNISKNIKLCDTFCVSGFRHTFPADQRGFPADQRGFPADQEGFPADQEGFPADQNGFPADQIWFPADKQGQPWPIRGFWHDL